MLTDLRLDDQALWKQRYRTPVTLWTRIAKSYPTRGLAANNMTGKNQPVRLGRTERRVAPTDGSAGRNFIRISCARWPSCLLP